jgi:hypothetical protein
MAVIIFVMSITLFDDFPLRQLLQSSNGRMNVDESHGRMCKLSWPVFMWKD